MDVGATRPRSAKRKKASSDVEDGSPAKGYTARPDGYGKDVVSSISSLMNSSTNDMVSDAYLKLIFWDCAVMILIE